MKHTSFIYLFLLWAAILQSVGSGCKSAPSEMSSDYSWDPPGSRRQIEIFLVRFKGYLESHDWGNLINCFDIENYKTQSSFGIGFEQYIIEGMYCNMEQMPEDGTVAGHYKRLGTIRSVSFTQIVTCQEAGDPDCLVYAHGTITLKNGRIQEIKLRIKLNDSEFLVIYPPLG